ncbi:MAG: amino acid-binding protein [Dysgonamonadaceae bacterium]|jgi:hypothetical protein|nr:amino acid-binding protein [Dysgonamonadaceae bacterium]
MLIRQLSIFLENKRGRFNEVATLLGREGINMTAFNVSENSDFGILRLIVSDPTRAIELLKRNSYAVTVTEVICIQMPNIPGALASVMNIIDGSGVSIEYMYAFSTGNKALSIIRPDDLEKTLKALSDNKVELLAANALFSL